MSRWATIESAVVQALENLAPGGSALLATVKAVSVRDRKVLFQSLHRERLPAAYVMATHRDAGTRPMRRPGGLGLSVLLAAGSLRSDDEARKGSSEVTGAFTLAEVVAGALQDLIVAGDERMLLIDERPAGGDEGMIVWEQRYELRRESEGLPPTFGGALLAGADSVVNAILGPLRRASSSFAFPGVDGVFERSLGVRERPIAWRGQLRAADDAALNALEVGIENELRSGEAKAMTDAWGRSHASCVLQSFERQGPRHRDELTGEALQDFEITFTQLGG